ncbi:hypothetical protein KSP39_PZI020979 [Platanthera zijinensis]|uniref:Uncharacterized protein n=1 Tax=Platanthera zijinensis TaxID=2320716 RepID=A0AAP0FW88_9ASPA
MTNGCYAFLFRRKPRRWSSMSCSRTTRPGRQGLRGRYLHYRRLQIVEDAKGIQEIFDKFKKSGFERIEQLKCACIQEKRSVEDSIVIEEMSDKLKKSCLEMIEQLKDMLGFVLVSPDLDIDCKDTKFEGDKCANEVITPRVPSPHTEYEIQLSVEDMEMIDEMSEKLTKYIEVLGKLKAMHGFTSHSRDFYIDRKKKKPSGINTRRSHVFNLDMVDEVVHGGPVYAHLDSHIYPVKMEEATTAC